MLGILITTVLASLAGSVIAAVHVGASAGERDADRWAGRPLRRKNLEESAL